VSVEFAYIDVTLTPESACAACSSCDGFVNELHEPTVFRRQTTHVERLIILDLARAARGCSGLGPVSSALSDQ
jgi:hypothetical protein